VADQDLVKKLKQNGVADWNVWRAQNAELWIDLSGADLRELDLSGANLIDVDLSHARLAEADLSNAQCQEADFLDADLRRAYLHRAILSGANLVGANLREAYLGHADLSAATLLGADLTRCVLAQSRLNDLDMSECIGLETIRHQGPSSIGIDTIFRSASNFPEAFLRGAGVPEPFINNMKSLVAAMLPIEFYSCFISYSSRDQEFAERLHADLRSKNVRCWFAPEDLKIGDRLRPSFDEAIRVHDKLMVLLSEHSVRSEWVEKEVETAFEKERREKRTVLFPIRLDDAVMEPGEAWAADIRRTRHIGDFRNWKNHDAYKKALDRLLRDLKA
jgi:uncharacterized protein YjbI with pentapeptide repeats